MSNLRQSDGQSGGPRYFMLLEWFSVVFTTYLFTG